MADNLLVFTVTSAFWTQVDYRTRLLQPWEELARGPQPAQNNLFLDYISPNLFSAFWVSLRFRHWPVCAILFGSFSLKVLVVVSTSLFVLRTSIESVSIPISLTDQFQEREFNFDDDNTPAVRYYGTLIDHNDYLPGTNADYAVEMFQSSEDIYCEH